MTNKEKFLAGKSFVLNERKTAEAMKYDKPIGNHPFGSILTSDFRYHIAICETPSITEDGFSCWGYWMGTHQVKKIAFSEIFFFRLTTMDKEINKVWFCTKTWGKRSITTESSVRGIQYVRLFPDAIITLETLNGEPYICININRPANCDHDK